MTIVADSGSTKTTWAMVETGNKVVTEGLNPHFSTDQQVLEACAIVRQQFKIQNSKFNIHFYGAGCGNKQQAKRMKILLQQGFATENVYVDTDMLGACYAVGAGRPCVVAIMGTGSNACLFDGEAIVRQPASTGYILGDRGSANHAGRKLLDDYLSHRMPANIRQLFHNSYPMSDAQFINAVYHQPHPNRFLASLAPFAIKNIENDYCHGILSETFDEWYFYCLVWLLKGRKAHTFSLNWDGEVNFVGGYAKAVEPMLKDKFYDSPFHVGTVIADPIDGLIEYHRVSKNS
ncbi:MAG: hypothetical protein J6T88_01575 [Bacteroidales bacterium]|nr:hypothetical protein [Bacteroidales bacterium]